MKESSNDTFFCSKRGIGHSVLKSVEVIAFSQEYILSAITSTENQNTMVLALSEKTMFSHK